MNADANNAPYKNDFGCISDLDTTGVLNLFL